MEILYRVVLWVGGVFLWVDGAEGELGGLGAERLLTDSNFKMYGVDWYRIDSMENLIIFHLSYSFGRYL